MDLRSKIIEGGLTRDFGIAHMGFSKEQKDLEDDYGQTL